MIRPSANLRSSSNDDGAAVMNVARNQITVLDAMGGYIWRQLESGMDQDAIVDRLARETGEDAAIIRRDVQEFLGDLANRSLLDTVIMPSSSEEGA